MQAASSNEPILNNDKGKGQLIAATLPGPGDGQLIAAPIPSSGDHQTVAARGNLVEGGRGEAEAANTPPDAGALKPRRGRPRKWGFSMDPVLKPGSDDMISVLLGIRPDNVTLKSDILSTLDIKMSQFKEGLAQELDPLKENVNQQKVELEQVQRSYKLI